MHYELHLMETHGQSRSRELRALGKNATHVIEILPGLGEITI